jgi:hypothetical protein
MQECTLFNNRVERKKCKFIIYYISYNYLMSEINELFKFIHSIIFNM